VSKRFPHNPEVGPEHYIQANWDRLSSCRGTTKPICLVEGREDAEILTRVFSSNDPESGIVTVVVDGRENVNSFILPFRQQGFSNTRGMVDSDGRGYSDLSDPDFTFVTDYWDMECSLWMTSISDDIISEIFERYPVDVENLMEVVTLAASEIGVLRKANWRLDMSNKFSDLDFESLFTIEVESQDCEPTFSITSSKEDIYTAVASGLSGESNQFKFRSAVEQCRVELRNAGPYDFAQGKDVFKLLVMCSRALKVASGFVDESLPLDVQARKIFKVWIDRTTRRNFDELDLSRSIASWMAA